MHLKGQRNKAIPIGKSAWEPAAGSSSRYAACACLAVRKYGANALLEAVHTCQPFSQPDVMTPKAPVHVAFVLKQKAHREILGNPDSLSTHYPT